MPFMKSLVDGQRYDIQGYTILPVDGGYGYRRVIHGYEYRRCGDERAFNKAVTPSDTEDRTGEL